MPLTNAEVRRRYRKRHLARVRAADRERMRQRRAAEPEHVAELKSASYRRNAGQINADRYAKDPVAAKAAAKQWRADNPERARELARAAASRARARRRGATVGEDFDAYVALLAGDPCSYCADTGTTVDHIVALNAGGEHAASNATAACKSCNSAKMDRPLLLFLLRRLSVA